MSQETVIAFIAKVHSDKVLQDRLTAAIDAAAAITIAKTAGFDITAADLIRHQATLVAELSDEALEGVAGGLPWLKVLGFTTAFIVGPVAGPLILATAMGVDVFGGNTSSTDGT